MVTLAVGTIIESIKKKTFLLFMHGMTVTVTIQKKISRWQYMSPIFLYMVLISSVVEYAGKKKKILYESPFEGWSN